MLCVQKIGMTFERERAQLTLGDGRIVTPVVKVGTGGWPDWREAEPGNGVWVLNLFIQYTEGKEEDPDIGVWCSLTAEVRFDTGKDASGNWYRDAVVKLTPDPRGSQLKACRVALVLPLLESVWIEADGKEYRAHREWRPIGEDPAFHEIAVPISYLKW